MDFGVIGRIGSKEPSALATTKDSLFAGRLSLLQPASGHRAGTDAVLLAAATPTEAKAIADLGASTGVVGLRAAQMNPEARVTLIERDGEIAAIAGENAARNGLSERVSVCHMDAFRLGKESALRETFDCILTNPPFFAAGDIRVSTNPNRADAHVLDGSLADWVKNAVTILAPKGRLIAIHRADAIGDLLLACARRLGEVRLRFVHKDAQSPAIRVLLSARKGSRAPVVVLPPVFLHAQDDRFTPEVETLHRGEGRLDMLTAANAEAGGKSRPS